MWYLYQIFEPFGQVELDQLPLDPTDWIMSVVWFCAGKYLCKTQFFLLVLNFNHYVEHLVYVSTI
jgi:hypothetical protein